MYGQNILSQVITYDFCITYQCIAAYTFSVVLSIKLKFVSVKIVRYKIKSYNPHS